MQTQMQINRHGIESERGAKSPHSAENCSRPRGNIARIIVRKVFTGRRAATEKPAAHNLCYVNSRYTLCTVYVRNTGRIRVFSPGTYRRVDVKLLYVCASACEIRIRCSDFLIFRFEKFGGFGCSFCDVRFVLGGWGEC